MTTSKRIKPASITRHDAERLVTEIAALANDQRAINSALDAEIIAARDKVKVPLANIAASIKEKSALVRAWADENPDAFDKRKSIDFANGTIGFRTGTPKAALLNRSWTWEKVLDAVTRILPAFVRNKPEIDKEAIIGQREELSEYLPMVGIKVVQEETFFIEPRLTDDDATVREAA